MVGRGAIVAVLLVVVVYLATRKPVMGNFTNQLSSGSAQDGLIFKVGNCSRGC
jgi:hypothetical protein